MILEALTLGAAAFSLKQINDSTKLDERALLKREKAIELKNHAESELVKVSEEVDLALTKLYNIRKGILKTSISRFSENFRKISSLKFLKSLTDFDKELPTVIDDQLTEIGNMVEIYQKPLTDRQVIVSMCFGTMGISYAIKKESEKKLAIAGHEYRQAQMIKTQVENHIIVLNAIKKKADIMWDLLRTLNGIFYKAIETTEELILKNGSNEKNYSDSEVELLKTTIQMADAILKLSNAPILDEKGALHKDVDEVIKRGDFIAQNALNQIQEGGTII